MGGIDVIDVVQEDGAVAAVVDEIVQQLFVDLLHHILHHAVEDDPPGLVGVDHGVVFPLITLYRLEVLFIHHNVRLSVAVFDDVDHQIVDDLGVDGADAVGGVFVIRHHLHAGGVLPILAEIRDDIRDTHHVTLQRRGLDLVGIAGDGVAFLQFGLKFFEGVHRHGVILRHFDLAVVSCDTR